MLSDSLNISLDRLMMQKDDRITWLPFLLQSPLRTDSSIDSLFDYIESDLDIIEQITNKDTSEPVEMGTICYSFPLELCFYSPPLLKFILFKWGHNFLGTEEFNHYTQWEIPDRVSHIFQKMKRAYRFDKIYYIWDSSIIWILVNEIKNLYDMGILTDEEKNAIRDALKEMMYKSEQTLNGTYIPIFDTETETDFYVSTQYTGFTNYYCMCGEKHFATFHTNFNFCRIDNDPEAFLKLKEWIDSFKMLSTKLSGSGRVERKRFFDMQHKTIDLVLGQQQ